MTLSCIHVYVLSRTSISARNRQTGVLGHQTKDKAMAALQNCPLLDDLAEWTHWELVFQPELGGLKEFVQKYGGVYQLPVTGQFYLVLNVIT